MVQIVDPFAPAAPSIVDPFAAAPDTSATQQAGVAARTLAPYATAAAMGAAMGAPALGVGAIPGAIAGVGGLGIGNIAAGAYNLAAPMFGGSQIPTPSEVIRNVFAAGGVGRKPVTSEQALGASVLEGTLDALSLSGAGRVIGGRVGNFFSQRPVVQAVGGAGGAAVPTAMREYGGVENPYALAAGSLAGGITAAKTGSYIADKAQRLADAERRFVTGANIAPDALRQRAQDAFNATDASGVTYQPAAIARLANDTRQQLARSQFDPTSPRYTEVNAALARVDDFAQQPQTIGNLHSLRQDFQHIQRTAYRAGNADAGRMIDDVINSLDDFVAQATNATTAAGAAAAPQAAATLRGAITDWSRLSKADVVESLIERAGRADQPVAVALQSQFRTLANNPRRLARFDENERAVIREIAGGGNQSATLKLVSQLAPSLRVSDIIRSATLSGVGSGAAFMAGASPLVTGATALGLTTAGFGARAARNAMASSDVNAFAAAIRRGDVRAPARIPAMEMMQRGIPQAVLQAQQPSDYFFPENAMAR